jgi:hypothetical protein
MTAFSQLALQTALYNKFTGDTTLMTLAAVYDRTPKGTAFPYVTIGDSTASDWSTKTTSGTEQNFSIHVWSREGGRAQAANIMERVYELLHEGTLGVPNHTLVLSRLVSSALILESDGFTYHGTMRFRALLQAS